MAQKIRFGLTLSNRLALYGATTIDEMLDLAEMADSSGMFEHVWCGDSMLAKPRLESCTVFAAVAARTKRVKIGPAAMASFPARNPILLALQWATLDVISHGRMLLCAGTEVPQAANKAASEYRNLGNKPNTRGARKEESIEILRMLWSQESVDYDGEFNKLEGAFCEPKPVQQPCPIWISGDPNRANSPAHIVERVCRRVARMGDGWMTTATGNGPDYPDFQANRADIIKYGKEYGRDLTKDFPMHLYTRINCDDNQTAALDEAKKYLDIYYAPTVQTHEAMLASHMAFGSAERCQQKIQNAIDAGFTDISLILASWDQMPQYKRLTEEVLPAFL